MSAKIILTVISGNLKGQKFEFCDRSICIIGRAQDCSLRLPNDEYHKTISRYHCLLDINPPHLRVRDFGSLHGTFVNGKIIGKREFNQTPEEGLQLNFPEFDLQEDDEIKLANTVFKVAIDQTQTDEETLLASANISIENPQTLAHNTLPEEAVLLQPKIVSSEGKTDYFFPFPQSSIPQLPLPNFPGYTIVQLLGKGGFGEVYLARQDSTQKLMALKVMRPQIAMSDRAKEMFFREAENTKALQHPHVIELQESGYADGVFFFTLEYCGAGSIANLVKEKGKPLSIDEAVTLIFQVLDGLEYAHNVEISNVKLADGKIGKARGLVHRDLKPANILLANNGKNIIAKIADYGLSKSFDLAGLSGLSMSGTAAGSPAYMPRQQVLNFKYAKPEVDVWAAAACLYYMLTGSVPRDASQKDPWLVVLQTKAIPIRQRIPSIPARLAEVIDQALIDNPDLHFKSAIAFKQALESVL